MSEAEFRFLEVFGDPYVNEDTNKQEKQNTRSFIPLLQCTITNYHQSHNPSFFQ